MSKVDAQRAMREAKYARLRASGPTRREAASGESAPEDSAPAAAPAGTGTAPARTAKAAKASAAPVTAEGGLCGHKSMNGRACTREAGHAEKNHRYG